MRRAAAQEADCRPHGCPTARRPCVLAVHKRARPTRGTTMYPRRQSQAAHLRTAIPCVPDHPADVHTAAHWMPPLQCPSAPSAYPHPPLHPHGPPLHTPATLLPPSAPFWELPPPSWPSSRCLAPSAPFVHPRHPPSPFHTLSLPSWPPRLLLHTPTAFLAPSVHPSHCLSTLRACRAHLPPAWPPPRLCSPSPPSWPPPHLVCTHTALLGCTTPYVYSRRPLGTLHALSTPLPPS
ncbi:hypothetical protein K439DRAFT_1622829 [Ramaria rubella]|nr:hypothetical protein K439DRAFT_1622829 [Ramaria rubella]